MTQPELRGRRLHLSSWPKPPETAARPCRPVLKSKSADPTARKRLKSRSSSFAYNESLALSLLTKSREPKCFSPKANNRSRAGQKALYFRSLHIRTRFETLSKNWVSLVVSRPPVSSLPNPDKEPTVSPNTSVMVEIYRDPLVSLADHAGPSFVSLHQHAVRGLREDLGAKKTRGLRKGMVGRVFRTREWLSASQDVQRKTVAIQIHGPKSDGPAEMKDSPRLVPSKGSMLAERKKEE